MKKVKQKYSKGELRSEKSEKKVEEEDVCNKENPNPIGERERE